MEDADVLDFLRRAAATARLVTSVCTGSLVLVAAGLLQGYRATCHWSSIDQLVLLGAIPVAARVVRDRNRITGAGVTSGIDFALSVAAELCGQRVAKDIQLALEYDPAFRWGVAVERAPGSAGRCTHAATAIPRSAARRYRAGGAQVRMTPLARRANSI